MKKILLLGFSLFTSLLFAGADFYQDAGATQYQKIAFNFGSGIEWKRSDNEINGQNYGTKYITDTWKLVGAEGFVWKDNGSDITSMTLYYRVYEQGTTAPGFLNFNLPWAANLSGSNQRWATTSLDIDLLT